MLLAQRRRLDAFLAERAAAACAGFRDARRVVAIDGTTVRLADGFVIRADVVVGADGANGMVARSTRLAATT